MSIGRTVLISHISSTAKAMPAALSLNASKIINDQLPRMAIFNTGIDGKMEITM